MSETERAGHEARTGSEVSHTDKSASHDARPALHVLTPAERDAFEAVRMGPYSPVEYATNTDRSQGTISNLLARAERKLKLHELEADARDETPHPHAGGGSA